MVKPFGRWGSTPDPAGGVYSTIFHNKHLEILKLDWKTPGFFFHPKEWRPCNDISQYALLGVRRKGTPRVG